MSEYDVAKSIAKRFFDKSQFVMTPSEWDVSLGDDGVSLIVETPDTDYTFKSCDFE